MKDKKLDPYIHLEFRRKKHDGKYVALCNICKQIVSNTSYKRLESHRQRCSVNGCLKTVKKDLPKLSELSNTNDNTKYDNQSKMISSTIPNTPNLQSTNDQESLDDTHQAMENQIIPTIKTDCNNTKSDLITSDDTEKELLPKENQSGALKSQRKVLDVSRYLEPFKYNWIRRVVYRTNKPNKHQNFGPMADVCYISPDGEKFWNYKKLKEYLMANPQIDLKYTDFTYSPKPLGLNDETKEILDYSRQTLLNCKSQKLPDLNKQKVVENLTREKSTRKIVRVRPHIEIESSDESYTTTRSYRKNTKRKHKSKHKLNVIKKQKIDLPSSTMINSTEILDEAPKPLKTICNTERFQKYTRPSNSMQALIDYHKSLQSIFNNLELVDLLRVRLVCTTWKDIADKPSFWNKVSINGSKITNWNNFARFLESHKTKYLNIREMICAQSINWDDAATAIARTSVTDLELGDTSVEIVQKFSEKCTQLNSLKSNITNSVIVNLNDMDRMHQHSNGEEMQVTYESLQGINLQGDLAPLLCLSHLTNLTLKTLKNLTTFKLGEGLDFYSTSMQNTRFLRVERLESQALISFNIIEKVSSFARLEHLELIDFEVEENFDEYLKKCVHLKSIMLIPAHSNATSNRTILKGILSLKHNLKSVIWAVHSEQLKKSKELLWKPWHIDSHRDIEFIPILEPVPFLYLIDSTALNIGNKQEKNDDETLESFIYSIKMLQLTQIGKLITLAMPETSVSILKIENFRPVLAPEIEEPTFYTVLTEQ